jgi:hypothetical protein
MMTVEATMSRNEADEERRLARRRAELVAASLERGVNPYETLSSWYAPGLFGSDEEVDEFNAWIEAERGRGR